MTQTESTTKTRGLFARLFGSEDAQPTPHDVDEQIMHVETERADLQRQRAQLEQQITDAWGTDTSALEVQAVSIDTKLRAAGQVLERLQAEKTQAKIRRLIDDYRNRAEGIVAQIVELNGIETDEWFQREREYIEWRAQRARLRANISIGKHSLRFNRDPYLRKEFPDFDLEIYQAIIAGMDAVDTELSEHLHRNIVTLDLFEAWLGKKEKPNG